MSEEVSEFERDPSPRVGERVERRVDLRSREPAEQRVSETVSRSSRERPLASWDLVASWLESTSVSSEWLLCS